MSASKNQEEVFAEQLIREGYKEVDGVMYPSENNMFYDGLNRPDLVECFRTFTNEDHSEVCSIVTYGKKMCGHRGILHGGASGSTLDQFFGLMICLQNIKGFTGQLSISYRKIVLCPSTILIRGKIDHTENRKHYFKAIIYDELDDLCVEATCLFIQSDIQKVLDRAMAELESKKWFVCCHNSGRFSRAVLLFRENVFRVPIHCIRFELRQRGSGIGCLPDNHLFH